MDRWVIPWGKIIAERYHVTFGSCYRLSVSTSCLSSVFCNVDFVLIVLKIMDAGYCLYVHIFIHILSHLNSIILTILINSCQTSGFSKVGAIIKYNIMHFPVLIKAVLKLVYIICKNHIIR